MIIFPDDLTVKQLRSIEISNPNIPQTMRRNFSSTYDEFMDVLYDELDNIIRSFESDANLMQDRGEDSLNAEICRSLNLLGYNANLDKNHRGHADITVEFKTFTWIGEGKLINSVNNTYLSKGYGQLIDRYVTGTTNANEAGLIVYCFAMDAVRVTKEWFKHLEEKNIASSGYASALTQCSNKPNFAFWSSNKHPSSGSILKIKHMILSLHWKPHKK